MLHRFACATGPRLISSLMKTFSLPSLKFSLFSYSCFSLGAKHSNKHKTALNISNEQSGQKNKFSNRPKSHRLEFADACGVRNQQTYTLDKSMLNPRMLISGDSAQIMLLYFKMQIKCARKHVCKPCCEPLVWRYAFNLMIMLYSTETHIM